ncbi:hypothetical protein VSS37_00340 [Candidatus Thiothrix sp. Deng01]|uniref:Methyl-accepting chemotaxis protein n=1 Tax=Candidatus Thiothrix phosphatis TaxID=3112415 RepID=A0ABU6CS72_9GAMM|nr:hypothetical protein [Candidatus Thiothrix sp. Deng01]MEB4589416.1 hypothetical protein [Candidatus Thiothrix sp. Deng01]
MDLTSALSTSVSNVQSTLQAASDANMQMTQASIQHDSESSEQAVSRGASSEIKNIANQISQSMANG